MIEFKLMVPNNLVGTVDLFMVSHHGFKKSNSKLLVHSIRPKVAIMNNSQHKGGEAQVLDILRSSPCFQDLWQLHYSDSAKDKNAPEPFIANLTDPCEDDPGVGATRRHLHRHQHPQQFLQDVPALIG